MPTPITTERVRLPSGSNTLVGDLYRPVDAAEVGPAVVVTGSWTTVKEQMAGLYARRLAAEGLSTLAFDFTGYGQSQGELRDLEDPAQKAADIAAAVGYLTTRADVDAGRIGALAVCASSGYTAANAADDPRVASIAFVARGCTTRSWSSLTTAATRALPPVSEPARRPAPATKPPVRSTTCQPSRQPTSWPRCSAPGTTTSTPTEERYRSGADASP